MLLENTASTLCRALLRQGQAGTFVPFWVPWICKSGCRSTRPTCFISQSKKLSVSETSEPWRQADFTEHPVQKAKQAYPCATGLPDTLRDGAPLTQNAAFLPSPPYVPVPDSARLKQVVDTCWRDFSSVVKPRLLFDPVCIVCAMIHAPLADQSGFVFEPTTQRSYLARSSSFDTRIPVQIKIEHESSPFFFFFNMVSDNKKRSLQLSN